MQLNQLDFYNYIPSNRDAFAKEVIRIAGLLKINPDDLMKVMYFESKLNPAAKNPYGSATGLIQFTSATAVGLGTSTTALRSMSNVDQLQFVYKYLKPYTGTIKNLTDLYLAVFYPNAINKPDSYLLPLKKEWVTANRIFDVNGDGKILKSEIGTYINKYFNRVAQTLTQKYKLPVLKASETASAVAVGLLFFL